ncbi:hypothetical protein [Cryocola sp. 340MFSha3.1]|uniref:hypothetical protein n=1 Tax=Cryocola sp. 340MFSha3.1 TaxID=1169145 RepID=UPI0012DFE6EA|nr:hypothetical protein [Cryocola sp. 340MFSha3.1]
MDSSAAALTTALIAATVAIGVFIAERIFNWRSRRRELRRIEFESLLRASVAYVEAGVTDPSSSLLDERARLTTAKATFSLNLTPSLHAGDLILVSTWFVERMISIGQDHPTTEEQEWRRVEQLTVTLDCLSSLLAIYHHGRWANDTGAELITHILVERDRIGAPAFVGDPTWWDVPLADWLSPPEMPSLWRARRDQFRFSFLRIQFWRRRQTEALTKAVIEMNEEYADVVSRIRRARIELGHVEYERVVVHRTHEGGGSVVPTEFAS